MAVELRGPAMRLKLSDDETDIDLDALQGLWSVKQYLKLTNHTCGGASRNIPRAGLAARPEQSRST
jgi:hypothetical protein